MIELLDALENAAREVRQFVIAYGDAVTMPARRQAGVDADGGRPSGHGISRPTETTALDSRRMALHAELKTGAQWLAYSVAATRGVSASMDRALSRWEGEDASPIYQGDTVDHHHGAAGH
ncbi:hypothetical protein ACGFZB_28815 [Streptomyces cinerochromogenes]|uniref:Uncharacterized protein n=1 Tax=Streptomyces cinerochromogenes TaxID=66422 RepID=A0ABW7BEK2_9ACTN